MKLHIIARLSVPIAAGMFSQRRVDEARLTLGETVDFLEDGDNRSTPDEGRRILSPPHLVLSKW